MSVALWVAVVLALAPSGCTRGGSRDVGSPSTATAPPLPIATGDFPIYGHSADFSWLAGRIARSLRSGDCTYVVFSSRPGAPWGGRLALVASPASLAAFPEGDLVVVRGDLDALAYGGCGPAYRVALLQEH